jgi:hypothetical protein
MTEARSRLRQLTWASLALIGLGSAALMLLVLPVWLALAWWSAALGILRYPGLRHADPLRFAHSEPVVAAFALLLPAVAAAVLALSADPDRPRRVRLRPVHDQSDKPEPPRS